MRDLRRNQQVIYYRNFSRQKEIVDASGNATGSYVPEYGPIKSLRIYVSPNQGQMQQYAFGNLENYDRIMSTSDVDVGVGERAVLWIDKRPTNLPHNYVVQKKAVGLNSVVFAIKKVEVSDKSGASL